MLSKVVIVMISHDSLAKHTSQIIMLFSSCSFLKLGLAVVYLSWLVPSRRALGCNIIDVRSTLNKHYC